MNKQCPICKQFVFTLEDDVIAICLRTNHIFKKELNKKLDEE